MDRREAEIGSVRAHMIYDAHKKSVGASYVLCLLLGGLGAHRFYLGHTPTAAVQLVLGVAGFLTGGLTWPPLWVWLLVDLFLIPGMVRKRNLEIADRFAFD
jgi:TM2 domain-containing membrane protein YozV